jgi:hypothetical protein
MKYVINAKITTKPPRHTPGGIFVPNFRSKQPLRAAFFILILPYPAGLKMQEPHGAEWLRTYKSNQCGKEFLTWI